ncbi:TIGR03086 family metal-binding protein [Pseudonocardia sp.]|uniref:TIGR03086 family metal-binding protein n=1 Tax=Pseudonocardia sp. TaxID=60912 RepID=UPI003D0B778B
MTAKFDLEPAASAVATLLDGVTDEDLVRPTPCDYPVAALLDHLVMLTGAFTDTARKVAGRDGPPPGPDAARLDPQWRTTLPRRLDELVLAWREPSAWEGMASAGGVTWPAEVMAVVTLDELVLHGWDLARATGQPFEPDPVSAEIVHGFTAQFDGSGGDGLFGPRVAVAADAPLFDRALGNAGRDPGWTP